MKIEGKKSNLTNCLVST